MPLALPALATADVRTEVHLEVKRGAFTVGVAWPGHALGELAGFVRELLR